MSKPVDIQAQLDGLRSSAQNYRWRDCETQMFALYTQLPLPDGMRIAIEQLGDHLGTFERYHPSVRWVREWFNLVQRLEPFDISQYRFPFHSETALYDRNGIAAPGSTPFMDGITLMQEAFDSFTGDDCSPEKCLSLVRGVVGSSISARTFAYAADTCPEAWEDTRVLLGDIRITDEYSIEELEERNLRRRDYDLCTNDYQKGLWLALADQIEALLL